MAQLDVLQITQDIPAQYMPYIILFGSVFFLLSLVRIPVKIRLVVALVASIGVNVLYPSIVSPVATLGNVPSIGVSMALLAIGLLMGRKHKVVYSQAKSPAVIKGLEAQKAKLISQLNKANGNASKERQISAKISVIDDQIRRARAKLGLPV